MQDSHTHSPHKPIPYDKKEEKDPMTLQIHSATSQGTTRADNQDSFLTMQLSDDTAAVGVFDGMGGLENGAKTSSTVMMYVREAILRGLDSGVFDIESAIRAANQRIFNDTKPGSHSGSTVTFAFIQGNRYRIYHAGDSRAIVYRVGAAGYSVLTHDDTAYNKYFVEAKYPNAKYCKGKYKSQLVSAIGVMISPKITVTDGYLLESENLLLCSDGFWHSIDKKIVDITKPGFSANLPEAIKTVEASGEKDNITVLAVERV